MKTDQNSAKSIFLSALDIASETERQNYIDKACSGNSQLLAQVNRLLAHHGQSNSFLESPIEPNLTDTFDQAASDYVGHHVGPYKIRERIGDGGMGVVYVAEQEKPLRRKVAVKVIKPGMDSKAVLGRFEAERNVLALMNHPNIAKVLDAGTTKEGRPYFVMELVNGIPITGYCDEQKLSINARLRLFVDVCSAIQHAHQKGIIHRDIKPSNALVTELDGKPIVKVIDFGVAKALNQSLTEHSVYTAYQTLIGTPLYMSPEQASFSAVDVDTRSDVYSLGVLLYELVTGTTPFTQEEFKKSAQEKVFQLIREQEPPRPSIRISSLGDTATRVSQLRCVQPEQLGRIVKGDLDWIAMKALSKERNRRYESASRFSEDVERYLNSDLVEARPPSTAYRLSKFYRRNRSFVVATSLVILALSIGLGIAIQAYNSERRIVAEKNALLAQLREIRSEDILEAVLNGDVEEASNRLNEYKETLGESDVELNIQLELHEALIQLFGSNDDRVLANKKLTGLAEKFPKDVMAQSMYVRSILETGDEIAYFESVERLHDLSPRTFNQFLFRGFAMSHAIPDDACEDLRKAVELRPASVLAHCLLSDALQGASKHSFDPLVRQQLGQEAKYHADIAVAISPKDYLLATISQLEAYTLLIHACKQFSNNNTNELQRLIAVVKEYLESRRAADDWRFHAAKLQALQILRKHNIAVDSGVQAKLVHISNVDNVPVEILIRIIHLKYLMGDLQACKDILDRHSKIIKGYSALSYLAEIEFETKQNRSIEDVLTRIGNSIGSPTPTTTLESVASWPLLKLIGRNDLAEQHARALVKHLEKYEHVAAAKQVIPLYKWLLGNRNITAEQLLQSTNDSNAFTHVAVGIGIDALSRGDRQEAKRMFQLAADGPLYHMYDVEWAAVMLNKLSSHDWPGWLKENSEALPATLNP